MKRLRAPFPWFGGKSRVAHLVWERFGPVDTYNEPFFGSGAVLLGRPHPPRVETVNDLDCMIANFWRALQHDPAYNPNLSLDGESFTLAFPPRTAKPWLDLVDVEEPAETRVRTRA